MGDFESWWRNDGSGMSPQAGHDVEEHAREVAKAAWLSAIAAEREACAMIADEHARHHANNGAMSDASIVNVVADAIRGRAATSDNTEEVPRDLRWSDGVLQQRWQVRETRGGVAETRFEWRDVPTRIHDSDCAIHNGPALPVGDCDCK